VPNLDRFGTRCHAAGAGRPFRYRTFIKTFLKDVAADSGLASNVYFSDTQYFDSRGNIFYNSQWGGVVVMTSPFPTNGCVDPATNDADPTINVLSHEHNEMMTDPDVSTGWYDNQGYENGDKCAWLFGTSSGPSGGKFNQTINTHHYYLQMEWSNQGSHCVQTGL